MRVSEFFNLGRQQPYLDFVDVPIDTDIKVFVDPTALRSLESPWAQECTSLLQNFFSTVLSHIKAGQDSQAIELVSSLRERNEFHLGFSSGKSQGRAFGAMSARSVWGALATSAASKTGMLKDLEDTCLLIEGIGKDMISDAVCNIIRRPLIEYTQSACGYYGIPMSPGIASGPIWNPIHKKWQTEFVDLPVTPHGKLLLVPKIIVRHRLSYEFNEYYRHYLLPEMQAEHLRANTALVELLKDGGRRVTKKALINKYGSNKLAVVEQTIQHPGVLVTYKDHKERHAPPPLNHAQFAEIENEESPDWDTLIAEINDMPTGDKYAKSYEDLIERILTALFYPTLCSPTKQLKIHEGRKRIDITYTNEAKGGFFYWAAHHFTCPFIFVECKNYGKEIGNPELDQLSGRFSPSRGKVGFLVCRSVAKPEVLQKRCKDTALDHRGYIIVLTDEELVGLMENAKEGITAHKFPLFSEKFSLLVN